MTQENIIIPPAENDEGKIYRRVVDKENVGFFQRACVRKIMAGLNNSLQDAATEVGIAKYLYGGPGGYRMMSYGRVSGMSREDLNNYQIEIKKRYEAWHGVMRERNEMLEMAKNICQLEWSLDKSRLEYRISEGKALKWLQEALNEYAIIAGWGNQIEVNV